jgi:exopolysaccharide biosynthesis WecB/TagA/CpsF family protein
MTTTTLTARTIPFLGLNFSSATLDEVRAAIDQRADASQPFTYLATPNVDHVVKLHAEPEARWPLYAEAWGVCNDSRILALLARWSGLDLPTAPGSDLTAAIIADDLDPAEPVTIIGGDAALIAGLKQRYGLRDVRWHCPPMGLRSNPEALAAAAAFVAAQRTRLTFLCVGSPQQEMLAAAIAARGDAVGLGLCVGASLEFLSGAKTRAPAPLRAIGLEWLHRLACEPQRLWRRYLIEGPAIFAIWWRWEQARGRSAATAPIGRAKTA